MSYQPPQSWAGSPVTGILLGTGSAALVADDDVQIYQVFIESNATHIIVKAEAHSSPGGTSPRFTTAECLAIVDLSTNLIDLNYHVFDEIASTAPQHGTSQSTLTSSDFTLIPGVTTHEVYISNFGGSSYFVVKARDVSSVVDTGVVRVEVQMVLG